MAELDSSRVSQALLHLQNSQPQIFGMDAHSFQLKTRLNEVDVRVFEKLHHVVLPSDYREFITTVGDGGAGPFYGVFPLGMMDDNFDLRKFADGDIGVLSEPFPFVEEWNDVSGMPSDDLLHQNEPKYWEQMDSFQQTYWGTSLVNGALPICHQGCALRILLVLTGPQAGYLWDDRRSENEGLKPIQLRDGSPATFSSWYDEWLEGCLESVTREAS